MLFSLLFSCKAAASRSTRKHLVKWMDFIFAFRPLYSSTDIHTLSKTHLPTWRCSGLRMMRCTSSSLERKDIVISCIVSAKNFWQVAALHSSHSRIAGLRSTSNSYVAMNWLSMAISIFTHIGQCNIWSTILINLQSLLRTPYSSNSVGEKLQCATWLGWASLTLSKWIHLNESPLYISNVLTLLGSFLESPSIARKHNR